MVKEWYLSVFEEVQRFVYERTKESIQNIVEKTQKDLEQRYDQAYERIKDYFFTRYRTDPAYKHLSDKEVQQMAEAEAKKWIEHHKVLAIVFTVIVNTIVGLGGLFGFLIGGIQNEIERGKQLANYLAPILLPDVNTLISAYFLEKINKDLLEEIAKRLGYDSEMLQIIIDASKSYLTQEKIRDAYYKKLISKDEAIEHLKRLGVDERVQEIILEIDRPLLSPTDIKDLYLRDEIDEETHDRLMSMFGYTKEQIDLMKKLYFYIPTIPDLIRLAVREAFSPESIEKFRMYEDYPEEFEEWAKKQGLSPEWAKRFWYAHWELPSLTQGYEMLHRRIISEDELKMLMKAQDVMPFWRDKLIQLSYEVFTRVDVRRMYEEGVLTEEEVKQAYMDLGYDEEKAEKLTKWTVKQATSEDRKLTRSIIEDLFKRNILKKQEAIQMLVDLGYRQEYAELIVAKAEYDKEKKIKDRVVNAVKEQYLKGLIDENGAIEKLSKINMLSDEIDLLIYEWQLEKESRQRHLTIYQLERIARKGIIDRKTFIKEAKKLGYTEQHADWLYRSL